MFTPGLPRHQMSVVALCITLLAGASACTKPGDSTAEYASRGESTRAVELGAPQATAESERVSGSVTVTAARPSAGDGIVQVFRRAPLAMPGALAAFALEGVSGPLQHGFLVVFDSAGAVQVVTHKWTNADNSVVAQTDCGSRQKCPPTQVTANPKTGTVTFNGLILTGLDGNTGDAATSTLTGRVP
jgi:hypothetical protein